MQRKKPEDSRVGIRGSKGHVHSVRVAQNCRRVLRRVNPGQGGIIEVAVDGGRTQIAVQVIQIHEPEKMPQNRHRSTVRPAIPGHRELEACPQRRECNSKFSSP